LGFVDQLVDEILIFIFLFASFCERCGHCGLQPVVCIVVCLLECLENVFNFYRTLDNCVVQKIEKVKKVKL